MHHFLLFWLDGRVLQRFFTVTLIHIAFCVCVVLRERVKCDYVFNTVAIFIQDESNQNVEWVYTVIHDAKAIAMLCALCGHGYVNHIIYIIVFLW